MDEQCNELDVLLNLRVLLLIVQGLPDDHDIASDLHYRQNAYSNY